MRLYIANPTVQKQTVCYRVDFDKDGNFKDPRDRQFQPARQQTIEPGLQSQLGGDMNKAQIDDIIEQLKPYGLIHAKDVSHAPTSKVPYIYSIDAYVPADVMRRIQFHNSAVMEEAGRQRRAAAAIGSNDVVQRAVQNKFIEMGIPAQPADSTTVTFEQLDQSEAGEKRIEEGFEVVPEGQRGPRSGKLASTKPKRK